MDLVSGYILLEKKTSDRKYQTWFDQVQKALSQIGIGGSIKSLVSDRALALIQLAVQGHGTQSIPDLFHAMRYLSRYIGALLGGKLARTKRQLQQTSREITARQLKKKPISVRLNQRLRQLTEEYQFLALGVESYRSVLHQISTIVHPFAVDGSGFQTGVDIQDALRSLLPSLAALGQTYQLTKIEKALEKFSFQNFDLKRASGSTAASRFFGQDFPELFPWLISRMGDLPEPRKSRKSRKYGEPTISIASR